MKYVWKITKMKQFDEEKNSKTVVRIRKTVYIFHGAGLVQSTIYHVVPGVELGTTPESSEHLQCNPGHVRNCRPLSEWYYEALALKLWPGWSRIARGRCPESPPPNTVASPTAAELNTKKGLMISMWGETCSLGQLAQFYYLQRWGTGLLTLCQGSVF